MRVFVTGGGGFIGSHLCDLLISQGHKVTILDDLSTGSIRNVEHLRSNQNFTCVIDSIYNKGLVQEYCDWADIVYHLGAAVGVKLIVHSPVSTIKTNVEGTEIVLDACAKKKRPVFIASTSEVYGKSTAIPFKEDDDVVLGPTVKARWSYACSKLIDEFMALSYFKEQGVPVIICRLFNTVGPRQTGSYGMVLPRFVSQAAKGEDVTVYGTGQQSRCFCDVRDVVKALQTLMTNGKFFGQIFNVGSNVEITIKELAEKVSSLVNPKAGIKFIAYDNAYEKGFEDLQRRVPDLTRIKSAIGFCPSISLDQTIKDIAAAPPN